MKKLLVLVLTLLVFTSTALASPLETSANLEGSVYFPEGADQSSAVFSFSYQFPCIVPQREDDKAINEHFDYMMSDLISFTAPLYAQEALDNQAIPGGAYLNVASQITCNTEDYFSVLVTQEHFFGASVGETWIGYVFKRSGADAGMVLSLANVLSLSTATSDDGFAYERVTQKADDLVYELIWDIISEQMENNATDYFEGLTIDDLKAEFYPESDFYMDENQNVVFFIQPAMIATEAAGLLVYPFSIDELLSEL